MSELTPPHLDALSDVEYARMLEAAIAAIRGPKSVVIAVAGAWPGAGATTVAVLLAKALGSLRSQTVVAVDANPRSGALSHWLCPDGAVSSNVYRSLFGRDVSPDLVLDALFAAGPRLNVLRAPQDPSLVWASEEAHWARVIEHLRRMHNAVVVDCGTRRGADWADRVVLVNRFGQNPVALPGTRIPTVTVTNNAPRRHRIEGALVTLATEPEASARMMGRGLAWADAPPSWQEAIRELSAVLLAGS